MIYSNNVEQNFHDICKMLEISHKAGLVFNPDKFQFGQHVVEFAGLEVTMDGVRPCKKFLESIRSFPQPNDHRGHSYFESIATSQFIRFKLNINFSVTCVNFHTMPDTITGI